MVTLREQQSADEKILNKALGEGNYNIVIKPGGVLLETGGIQTPYNEFMQKLNGADNSPTHTPHGPKFADLRSPASAPPQKREAPRHAQQAPTTHRRNSGPTIG